MVRMGKCMVKLIYDFKQGRATLSNTEHAATSTSIYHSADIIASYWASFRSKYSPQSLKPAYLVRLVGVGTA